jgi:hypothetical protein
MWDFWYELSTPLRALMGLALMAIAAIIFVITGRATGGVHLVSYGLFAVGLIMLLFCSAGNSSGGYKF